jgi:hypothetical protein
MQRIELLAQSCARPRCAIDPPLYLSWPCPSSQSRGVPQNCHSANQENDVDRAVCDWCGERVSVMAPPDLDERGMISYSRP